MDQRKRHNGIRNYPGDVGEGLEQLALVEGTEGAASFEGGEGVREVRGPCEGADEGGEGEESGKEKLQIWTTNE